MEPKTIRKPLALANWKMAMTIAESLAFIREFQALVGDLLDTIDVVICPPFTALWPVAQVLTDSPLHLGAQNMAASPNLARTGQISATLLADIGCRWVMLGHWEVRRHLGDDDTTVNRKVHLALAAGLAPLLLIGEGRDKEGPLDTILDQHLARVLAGCQAGQVTNMAFLYEPEGAIGVATPTSPEQVAAGCGLIRRWLGQRYGDHLAETVRIIYGGSVTAEYAADLLAHPDVDGLGAGRRGRDPKTFVEIVRWIGRGKGG